MMGRPFASSGKGSNGRPTGPFQSKGKPLSSFQQSADPIPTFRGLFTPTRTQRDRICCRNSRAHSESLTRITGDLVAHFGYNARLIGTVAQLVEQGPFKALVLGSSPSRPTFPSFPATSSNIQSRL